MRFVTWRAVRSVLGRVLATATLSGRAVAPALAVVVIHAAEATGCTCVQSPPACEVYWETNAILLGTPVAVDDVRVGGELMERRFRFRVEEAFRGGITAREIDVVTAAEPASCGATFELGTPYLVYGVRTLDGSPVTTGLCTRTRPVSEAKEDLEYIRGLADAAPDGMILGTVTRFVPSFRDDGHTVYPIDGARVIATSGGRHFETRSNAEGEYRLPGLPAGSYVFAVVLPGRLVPVPPRGGRLPWATIEVRDRGCAQVDYQTASDGRVRGRLLDARGQPIAGRSVFLFPARSAAESVKALSERTDDRGRFEFAELPAGRYVLAINIEGRHPDDAYPRYPRVYYPASRTEVGATPLALSEGGRLSVDFRLLPDAVPMY